MNPAAILALLSSLYEQLVTAQQRIAELEAALAAATRKPAEPKP